ncbi:CPBP family intramembrane metalloprotease [Crossiella sp. CA-258035]|uniref:CPBP family intramembrane glutamic endopeptidase n=1 Tax=Crossiella sp. CA-258035 TaxID=2981138 RepID=UPI0024BCCCD6|nr:CPBP family intramembrane glutamic endopeptidase [Crossiella sp. CA-258035]WHT18837.1 CPBP family intramembrane metalloprotease [Crossiella sp. CA-258035]
MSPFLTGMDTARRPTGPWLALVVVALAMLLVGGAGGLTANLLLTGSATPQTGNLRGQVAMLVGGFAPVALVLWLWIRFKERRPFASAGFTTSPRGLALGALAAFLVFGGIVLATVLSGHMSFTDGPRWSLLPGALLALAAYAIQGSTEELLCRGFLLQALTRRWGVVAAVLVQAALFAALHTGNVGGLQVLAVLNLLLYGLFTAGWAIAEGGLWGVCGFHLMWNWVQGNVFGASVSGTEVSTALLTLRGGEPSIVNGAAFGLEASVVTTFALALGCALVFAPARRAIRG